MEWIDENCVIVIFKEEQKASDDIRNQTLMWISVEDLIKAEDKDENMNAGYFNIWKDEKLYPVWGVVEDDALKIVSNKAIYMFSKCPLLFKDPTNGK